MVALVGGPLAERVRATALALYALCGGARGARRDPPGGHQVRVRACGRGTGRARSLIDEVADARFLALLGRGRLRARPAAGELRQAVRARLAGDPAWDKTAPGPALPDEVVAGTRDRYIDAFERITGASVRPLSAGGCHRPMSTLPVRRQRDAQAGHPRPAGAGRGGQPGPPRRRGRERGPGRPPGRADRGGGRTRPRPARSSSGSPRSCSSNPLIEAYAVEPIGAASSSSDVAGGPTDMRPRRRRRLPGLQLRPRHAPRPARSPARRPVALWHEQASLDGVAAGGPARWLRLRRLPAGRRHRALQPGDAGGGGVRRRRAAWCSGICNGFQVLAEAGLVPGALLRNASLRFLGREVTIAVERRDTPFTRAIARPDGRCACRSRTARAATSPTRPRSTPWSVTARSCSATSMRPVAGRGRDPGQSQRLAARDRRRHQRGRATWPG